MVTMGMSRFFSHQLSGAISKILEVHHKNKKKMGNFVHIMLHMLKWPSLCRC